MKPLLTEQQQQQEEQKEQQPTIYVAWTDLLRLVEVGREGGIACADLPTGFKMEIIWENQFTLLLWGIRKVKQKHRKEQQQHQQQQQQ